VGARVVTAPAALGGRGGHRHAGGRDAGRQRGAHARRLQWQLGQPEMEDILVSR
jgi:hypothetical protein